MATTVFEKFDDGWLFCPGTEKLFSNLQWNNHPSFTGVSLKHLVTGKESNGLFSYHLVKIAPGHAIGDHIHDPQLETHEVIAGSGTCHNGDGVGEYRTGVISILPPRIHHSVEAGDEGLLLFAKFMPPLC